jgi:regulator of CtrA degradation
MEQINGGRRENPGPVSFGEALATSDAFHEIFREGMTLVEEAAAYLDGEGRLQAKRLAPEIARAYSAESMRLTTRLMQIASWLLLQRAVNQGDMTRRQSASQKHRVRLNEQCLASSPDIFVRLPPRLKALALHALRLQARIIRLDQLIYAATELPSVAPELTSPVQLQLARLREAFAVRQPAMAKRASLNN